MISLGQPRTLSGLKARFIPAPTGVELTANRSVAVRQAQALSSWPKGIAPSALSHDPIKILGRCPKLV